MTTKMRAGLLSMGWLTCAIAGAAFAQQASGTPSGPEPLKWSSLTMRASKFGLSMESTIATRVLSKTEALGDFVELPEGVEGVVPKGDEVILLEVRTELLGRTSRTRFWIDASNGQALQWIVVESGKRARYKASRALADGVWVLRKDPANKSERKKPMASWTKVRDRVEPFEGLPPGEALTESAGILYVLAAAPLRAVGDQFDVYLEAEGKVFPVSIKVEEAQSVDVDYRQTGPRGALRVDAKVPALRIRIQPRTPPGMDPREFKFMGLEGDVEVWLDARRRFPLRVSGKVPYAGKTKIRVKSLVLPGS